MMFGSSAFAKDGNCEENSSEGFAIESPLAVGILTSDVCASFWIIGLENPLGIICLLGLIPKKGFCFFVYRWRSLWPFGVFVVVVDWFGSMLRQTLLPSDLLHHFDL